MSSGLLTGFYTPLSLSRKWSSNPFLSGKKYSDGLFSFLKDFMEIIIKFILKNKKNSRKIEIFGLFSLNMAEILNHIWLILWNCRIPIWYTVKLIFGLWLVLPQFKGAAFLYDRFVRQQIKKHGFLGHHQQQQHQQPQQQQQQKSSPNGKGKKKFVQFITTKKVS